MTPSNIAKGLENAGQRMSAASKRIFALKAISPGAAIAAQRLLSAAQIDLKLLEGKIKPKAKKKGKKAVAKSAPAKSATKAVAKGDGKKKAASKA